jgi:hypothetical protein
MSNLLILLCLAVLRTVMSFGVEAGGASRDRTDDPLLAKQVLSQLSYGPSCFEPVLPLTSGL